jgi:hypothetical protein
MAEHNNALAERRTRLIDTLAALVRSQEFQWFNNCGLRRHHHHLVDNSGSGLALTACIDSQ